MSEKNVRSNYNINIVARYDSTEKKVFTEGIYSYRLYPSEKGYTAITVGFLKDELDSTAEVLLHFPNGDRKTFICGEENAKYEESEIARVSKIEINEYCSNYNHIDVELRVKECGQNHWMNIYFRAEQATDGFKFNLHCDDDITIKTYNLYDVGHNYHVDINESKTEINIACHQWINEGSGLSLIASRSET